MDSGDDDVGTGQLAEMAPVSRPYNYVGPHSMLTVCMASSEFAPFIDISSCENTKKQPGDCKYPLGTKDSIEVAMTHISEQLSVVDADERKPVAVYGGPATGKSTIMSLLFAELKATDEYLPMIVSLKSLAPYARVGYDEEAEITERKGLSPFALLIDMIARQLVEGGNVNVDDWSSLWGKLDRHIDSCAGPTKKFILLLDDLPCLECPLQAATENLLRSFFMKSNRCLVFSSCIPVFGGIEGVPCVPTARCHSSPVLMRGLYPDFQNLSTSDFYNCGRVPSTAYRVLKNSSAVTSTITGAWGEMTIHPYLRNAQWPPIKEFVEELFVATPYPKSVQHFTHVFACLMSEEDGKSCMYWPPFVIAGIMSYYSDDIRCNELQQKIATLIETMVIFSERWTASGISEWEITIRLSVVLWVIRMFEDSNIQQEFIHNFCGYEIEFSTEVCSDVCLNNWTSCYHKELHVHLNYSMDSAPNNSISVYMLSNTAADYLKDRDIDDSSDSDSGDEDDNDDDDDAGEPIWEYSGIIALKDCEGNVSYFGYLTEEERAGIQPDWIVRSVLILPHSERPTTDREAELRGQRWSIWTEDTVDQHLGISLSRPREQVILM
jgi:hypothetical protein